VLEQPIDILALELTTMDATFLQAKHAAGLTYDDYIASGKPQEQENWQRIYDQVQINDAQKELLGSFVRQVKVLALSGIWCGDCVMQGPLLQRIAEAGNGKIDLRWLDRDEHADLQSLVTINAGMRVPVLLFCAEDFELVSWYGDRTLARYRAMAKQALGDSCPLPGAAVPDDEVAATLADWIDQFERVQLLLRVSGRLRAKHGD
jgi:thiol-disulfide isomerase/thioredoxin